MKEAYKANIAHVRTHARPHENAYACTCARTYARAHAHTHVFPVVPVFSFACMYALTYVYTLTHRHRHTHRHTRRHTHPGPIKIHQPFKRPPLFERPSFSRRAAWPHVRRFCVTKQCKVTRSRRSGVMNVNVYSTHFSEIRKAWTSEKYTYLMLWNKAIRSYVFRARAAISLLPRRF